MINLSFSEWEKAYQVNVHSFFKLLNIFFARNDKDKLR